MQLKPLLFRLNSHTKCGCRKQDRLRSPCNPNTQLHSSSERKTTCQVVPLYAEVIQTFRAAIRKGNGKLRDKNELPCDAVLSCRSLPTYERKVLLPFSGSMTKPSTKQAVYRLRMLPGYFLLVVRLAYSSRPWRWNQFVAPKRRCPSTGPHGVTSHKIIIFIVNAVRTSNKKNAL
jgi:hypothetical protein